MTITSSGNVGIGIGMTAPNFPLDVAGNIHATGTIAADSDARFKQDLRPLTGVLAKLEALTPLSYAPSALAVARGQTPEVRQLGVLGQELEAVFPELVTAYGEEAYRAVDYSRLTVVLLEAIKEQQRQIEAQQQELERQRKQLEALRARLPEDP